MLLGSTTISKAQINNYLLLGFDDPGISVTLDKTIGCPYEIFQATVTMPGVISGQFYYTINGNLPETSRGLANGVRILNLNEPGIYEIVRYEIRDATNTVIFTNDTSVIFEIKHHFLPTASLSGGGNYCEGELITPLRVNFTGENPWVLTYIPESGIAVTDSFNNNSATLADADGQSIILRELNDKNCVSIVSGQGFVNVSPVPEVEIFGDTAFCENDSEVYSTTANPDYRYSWVNPTGAEIIETNGNYMALRWVIPGYRNLKLTVESIESGCISEEESLPIHVYANPIVKQGADTVVCFGEAGVAEIRASIMEENTVLWLQDNFTGHILNVYEEGFYEFRESIPFGCSGEGSVHVIEKCNPEIFVATAFTPNNDGINDVLEVKGIYYNLELKIYSANGEIVHHQLSGSSPWDGTFNGYPSPNGVYYWQASFTNKEGDIYNNKGKVTLLR
jgi:gliding motility-associated-like protein